MSRMPSDDMARHALDPVRLRAAWTPTYAEVTLAARVALARARHVYALLAVLSVPTVVLGVANDSRPLQTVLVGVLGAIALAAALGVHVAVARALWKRAETVQFELEVTDDGMHVGPGPAESTFAWSAITDARRVRDVVVIVHRDGRATHVTCVPRRAFASPEEAHQLAAIVSDHVPTARLGPRA